MLKSVRMHAQVCQIAWSSLNDEFEYGAARQESLVKLGMR